mmetsp:Transcript_7921/g.13128  ORF Transcript_7921/g.13128 Transcript_7921/m.13128 type:complete len:264 (-) Transcript_7921:296-1087(-)
MSFRRLLLLRPLSWFMIFALLLVADCIFTLVIDVVVPVVEAAAVGVVVVISEPLDGTTTPALPLTSVGNIALERPETALVLIVGCIATRVTGISSVDLVGAVTDADTIVFFPVFSAKEASDESLSACCVNSSAITRRLLVVLSLSIVSLHAVSTYSSINDLISSRSFCNRDVSREGRSDNATSLPFLHSIGKSRSATSPFSTSSTGFKIFPAQRLRLSAPCCWSCLLCKISTVLPSDTDCILKSSSLESITMTSVSTGTQSGS